MCDVKKNLPESSVHTDFSSLAADLVPFTLSTAFARTKLHPRSALEILACLRWHSNFSSTINTIQGAFASVCAQGDDSVKQITADEILKACVCRCRSIKAQDLPSLLIQLAGSSTVGRDNILRYLSDWQEFYHGRFKKELPLHISGVVQAALSKLRTTKDLEYYTQFFADKNCLEGEAGINAGLEIAYNNIELYKRAAEEISQL